MKKFVTAALATAIAGSVSFAAPNDNEWLELDSEINSLATNLRPARDGHGWSALIRSTYVLSFDDVATGGGSDVSGFQFEDIDVAFWGGASEYGWRINVDLDGNGTNTGPLGGPSPADPLALEDAYVFWDCGEFVTTMGQFKPRAVRSGYVDPENQLMINRTSIGSAFDTWELGVGFSGSFEDITWSASMQNGLDGTSAPSLWTGRVEYNLGEAASSNNTAALTEGALGGGEELNATVGGAIVYDDTLPGDGHAILLDVNGNMGQIGFGGEIGFLSDNFARTLSGDFTQNTGAVGGLTGDSTPYNVTASFLVNEEVEVGARYDNLDNAVDTSILSVVANWYQSEHSAKWQAQWSIYDTNVNDGSIFQIGLVVGGSR